MPVSFACPTVRVQHEDLPSGLIINAEDFDPRVHVLMEFPDEEPDGLAEAEAAGANFDVTDYVGPAAAESLSSAGLTTAQAIRAAAEANPEWWRDVRHVGRAIAERLVEAAES